MDSECRVLQQKIDARRRELRETLESLDGDLAIINTLRNSGGVQGKARSGLYAFIEKVLGPDDRDGLILVEYLRSNMRVADMPSRTGLTVQPIRSRVAHGFDKLVARLDAVHAVEDYDLLPLFRSLVAHAVAADPAPVKRAPGPKRQTVHRKGLGPGPSGHRPPRGGEPGAEGAGGGAGRDPSCGAGQASSRGSGQDPSCALHLTACLLARHGAGFSSFSHPVPCYSTA